MRSLGKRDLSALLNIYKSNNREPSLVAIGTILTYSALLAVHRYVHGLVAGASTTYLPTVTSTQPAHISQMY